MDPAQDRHAIFKIVKACQIGTSGFDHDRVHVESRIARRWFCGRRELFVFVFILVFREGLTTEQNDLWDLEAAVDTDI